MQVNADEILSGLMLESSEEEEEEEESNAEGSENAEGERVGMCGCGCVIGSIHGTNHHTVSRRTVYLSSVHNHDPTFIITWYNCASSSQ